MWLAQCFEDKFSLNLILNIFFDKSQKKKIKYKNKENPTSQFVLNHTHFCILVFVINIFLFNKLNKKINKKPKKTCVLEVLSTNRIQYNNNNNKK